MAILYYNNTAEDADWYNLNNWWTNEACTTQATSLPTSVDDVVVLDAYVIDISALYPIVINNLTAYGDSFVELDNYNVATILGVVKFYDTSIINQVGGGIDVTNVEFYDYSINSAFTFNWSSGVTAKFYDYSINANSIEGTAYFYDYSSCNAGNSNVNSLYFYDNSSLDYIYYTGGASFYNYSTYNDAGSSINCNFNDYSVCNGPVYIATFNDYSSNTRDQSLGGGAWSFNNNSFNNANLTANYGISFNNNSYNLGSIVDQNGTYGIDFNDNSFNNGIASAPYNNLRYNGFTGTNSYGTFVDGGKPTTLYYFYETGSGTEYWDITSWFSDENHSLPSQQFPSKIDSVVALSPILVNLPYPELTNLTIGIGSSNFFQYINTIHHYNGYVTINGECSIDNCFFDGASALSFNDNSSIMIDYGDTFGFYGSSISFNDNSFIGSTNGDVRSDNGSIYFNDNSFSTIVAGQLYAAEDIIFNGFTGTNSFGTFLNGKRQFYFNGAVDNEWQTLGNWWMDDAFSVPATSLPTNTDDVIASAAIGSNSGSEPTVANLTTSASLGVAITVTGDATFNGGAPLTATVNGDATFNDNSYNYGTITGDAVFNSASNNGYGGTVTGDATFNNGSSNDGGTVTGNATFNDSSQNLAGTVSGDATFNGTSANKGNITGNATLNNYAENYGYDSFGNISGDAIFNDNSVSRGGNVEGNAAFNNYASQQFNYDSNYNSFVQGSVIFNDYSENGEYSVAGDATFNDGSINNGSVVNATFSDSAHNGGIGTVTGNATFNDNSFNNGTVNGNANFNHNSYLSTYGSIGGTSTFNDASYMEPNNTNYANSPWTVVLGNRTPYPLRYGINNSNILGMI